MTKLIDEVNTSDRFILFIKWLVKEKGLGELAVIEAVERPYNKMLQELFDEFRGIE